jgi:hypothetical protein
MEGASKTAVAVPGADGAVLATNTDALPQLTMAAKLTPAQRRWKKKQRKMGLPDVGDGDSETQSNNVKSVGRQNYRGGGSRQLDPNSKNSKKRKLLAQQGRPR